MSERGGLEFTFHTVAPESALLAETDPTLAFLGAQGWEIRGLATLPAGAVLVALQRPIDEPRALPNPSALSAALAEPLVAPSADALED
jgi:hypothetical protein